MELALPAVELALLEVPRRQGPPKVPAKDLERPRPKKTKHR